MDMSVKVLEDGIHHIGLIGAFDINGAADVDLRFAALSGSRDRIVVDLSEVDMLASMGIRTLLVNAKVVTRRGGRFVLAGARPMVAKSLESASIPEVIPTFPDVATALHAIRA